MKKGLTAVIGGLVISVVLAQPPKLQKGKGDIWLVPPPYPKTEESSPFMLMSPDDAWITYFDAWHYFVTDLYGSEAAMRFYPSDFGVSYPLNITEVDAHFYVFSGWPHPDIVFRIYADDGTTLLYESPWLSMAGGSGERTVTHTLSSPVSIASGTFWVAVYSGSTFPHMLIDYFSPQNYGPSSYHGNPGSRYPVFYDYYIRAHVEWAVGGAPEIEVVEIDPDSLPDFIIGNKTYHPTAKIRNNGSGPANNVAVACSIWTYEGDLEYHSESTIPTINPSEEIDHTFADWIPQGYSGELYTVKVSTDFSDDNPDNNYKEKTCMVTERVLFTWKFEPTDDNFTHQKIKPSDPWVDDWEWGSPSSPSAYSPPNCWATIIDGPYSNYSSSRLLSPVFAVPEGARNLTLRFYHWYEIEPFYDVGNVKFTKDGITFDIIDPMGGYPYSSTSDFNGLDGERGYSGFMTTWSQAEFRIPLDPSEHITDAQFAWDFGSDDKVTYRGWYIDEMTVLGKQPPVTITSIEGLPSLAGINCTYTPSVWVENFWTHSFMMIDVLLRIEGGYESHQTIDTLAQGDSVEVTFDDWTAPPAPVLLADTFFVGILGRYLDTIPGMIQVGVDLGNHIPIEPIDTIFVHTVYHPLATIKALLGCEVPCHATLWLEDDTGKILYTSEKDIVINGSQDVAFDSVSVDNPGIYTFTLFSHNDGDFNTKNDTLRWEIEAKTVGALDVGTEAILIPSKASSGDSIAPKAIVKNYGAVRATNFDVECIIQPDGYGDTTTIASLEPGAVDTVELGGGEFCRVYSYGNNKTDRRYQPW